MSALFLGLLTLQLNLAQAIERALRNNPDYLARRVQVEQARLQFWRNLSGYLPQPSLSAFYSNSRSEVAVPLPGGTGPIQTQIRRGYDLNLQVIQLVFDPSQILSTLSTRNRLRQTELTLTEAEHQLVLAVMRAYFRTLKAQNTLKLRQEGLNRAQENYRLVQERYRLGQATLVDLKRAEVSLKQAEMEKLSAEQELLLAKRELLNYLGISESLPLSLEEPEPFEEPVVLPPLDGLIEEALRTRPQVRGAAELLSSQRSNLWRTALSVLPRASFGWYWRYNEETFPTSPGDFFDNALQSRSFFVSLSLDLLSYPLNLLSQRAAVREQELSLKSARLAVIREVTDAYNRVSLNLKRYEVARTNLEAARDFRELAQAQYRLGGIGLMDFLDAEVAYTEAEIQLLSAKYDLALALKTLQFAIGREVR